MFCKICNKPCAYQFDYCFEHRQKMAQYVETIKQKVSRARKNKGSIK